MNDNDISQPAAPIPPLFFLFQSYLVEQKIKLLTIVLSIYELPWDNSLAMLEVLIRVQYISVLSVQVLCHVELTH